MPTTEKKVSVTHLEDGSKGAPDLSGSIVPHTLTPEEEARVWRKIDLRLIPILALLYLFSFIDRGVSHILTPSSSLMPSIAGNIGRILR